MIPRCSKCGAVVCVCNSGGLFEPERWAAHCTKCGNCTGKQDTVDYCHSSRQEAEKEWTQQQQPEA